MILQKIWRSALPAQTAAGYTGAAVQIRGLSRDFGDGQEKRRVLTDINAEVNAGELTLLVGPSGCGKTTLISIIAGILSPTEGSVSLFGTPLASLKGSALVKFRLSRVGFVFQQFNLLPTLTAAENAGLPLAAAGLSRKDATRQGADMLGKLGMGAFSSRFQAQLSGGQQQRVSIARALVHSPQLVVCDEPTSALDAATGRTVMQMLRELAVKPDRVVIVVTHDERVYDFADRVLEMEDGRIKAVREGNHFGKPNAINFAAPNQSEFETDPVCRQVAAAVDPAESTS